jgi:hypothetical protein
MKINDKSQIMKCDHFLIDLPVGRQTWLVDVAVA